MHHQYQKLTFRVSQVLGNIRELEGHQCRGFLVVLPLDGPSRPVVISRIMGARVDLLGLRDLGLAEKVRVVGVEADARQPNAIIIWGYQQRESVGGPCGEIAITEWQECKLQTINAPSKSFNCSFGGSLGDLQVIFAGMKKNCEGIGEQVPAVDERTLRRFFWSRLTAKSRRLKKAAVAQAVRDYPQSAYDLQWKGRLVRSRTLTSTGAVIKA